MCVCVWDHGTESFNLQALITCGRDMLATGAFTPTVFVASDSWAGIEHASEVIGPEKVYYLNGSKGRGSCDEILHSVMEMFLLSRADIVIYSPVSSFPSIGMLNGGGVPVHQDCHARAPHEPSFAVYLQNRTTVTLKLQHNTGTPVLLER